MASPGQGIWHSAWSTAGEKDFQTPSRDESIPGNHRPEPPVLVRGGETGGGDGPRLHFFVCPDLPVCTGKFFLLGWDA